MKKGDKVRLSELKPTWLQYRGDPAVRHVQLLREGANGIQFLCPACFLANNKQSMGVHRVICWDPSVPQTVTPVPGRWQLLGDSFENLTLKAGSSSVQLNGGCKAHFFINNGDVAGA